MARLARVVAAGIPHHITQRGNARRFILDCDSDRKVYIDLLKENIHRSKVGLLGYCLMSNHVHLVAVPETADGLAQALKRTHARYASYWNALHGSSGHAWQEFRSFVDRSFVDRSFVDKEFRGQTGVSWTDGSFVDRREWHFRRVELPLLLSIIPSPPSSEQCPHSELANLH